MFVKKAKIPILFLSLCLSYIGLYADLEIPYTPLVEKVDMDPHEDELVAIERMILLTEQQIIAQKKIKNLITEMRHNKEIFLKSEDSKLHALYLISAAEECLDLIRKHHLYHLFSPDFMEELAVFAKVGKKS